MSGISVAEHLTCAKRDIAAGDKSLRSAAEHIAAAIDLGASQRVAASTVGKSAAWVNRLLLWRTSGFQANGPFVDDNKKKKERAAFSRTKQQEKSKISSSARSTMVKALGMLGSAHDGEIVNAARAVERLRRKFKATWEQLIVKATKIKEMKAA